MSDEEKLENLIRDLQSLARDFEKIKVEKCGARPVPVLKDKTGKLTEDYSLKDWLIKLHEEVLEFEAEVLAFSTLDAKPGDMKELYVENKTTIAGEACDIITVLYGICRQYGIDDNLMDSVMHNTYIKNKDRGYLDDNGMRVMMAWETKEIGNESK